MRNFFNLNNNNRDNRDNLIVTYEAKKKELLSKSKKDRVIATVIVLVCFVLVTFVLERRDAAELQSSPEDSLMHFVRHEEASADLFFTFAVESFAQSVNGLSLALFDREEVLLKLMHGYADSAAGMPVDSDTVFEWASITKLFVWISVIQLYEQGLLDLNADIFAYLPQEDFQGIVYPTTMHHLMHHMAGFEITDVVIDDFHRWYFVPYGEPFPTLGEFVREVFYEGAVKQRYYPGERFIYSNFGTALAGYIIERISAMPFYEYVHRYIFMPLNMYQTAIAPDLSDNPWVSERRDLVRINNPYLDPSQNRFNIPGYPMGSIAGTVSDMILFGRELLSLQYGESRLFANPQTAVGLFPSYDKIHMAAGTGNPYFNGFMLFSIYPRILGHSGGNIGFTSVLLLDVDNGRGLILGENSHRGLLNSTAFVQGLFEIVFKCQRW